MNKNDLDKMIAAWDLEHNGIRPDESTLAARLEILLLRALAEGRPITAGYLATLASVPVDLTDALFEHGRALGGEWDEQGRLLGNVLTLNPTPHHFRVNGRDLYTWCSLDAMHLPGLLGQAAEVESTDPINGQKIRLTIPPDGPPTYQPTSTLISVVMSNEERNGPDSPGCQQMRFFSSRDSADIWARDHPNSAIMSVEEVYQLVREQVHAPLASVLQELGPALGNASTLRSASSDRTQVRIG